MEKFKRNQGGNQKKEILGVLQEQLEDVKESKGLQQNDIADLAGLSESMVSSYFNGEKAPSVSTLIKLSNALGVPTDYLLGLTDDPSKKPAAVDDLALSHNAVALLKQWATENSEHNRIIDRIICDTSFPYFMEALSNYIFLRNNDNLTEDDKNFSGAESYRAAMQVKELSEAGNLTKYKEALIWAKQDLSMDDVAEIYRQKAMKEMSLIIENLDIEGD